MLAKTIFENVLRENPNHLKALEYINGLNKSWDNYMKYYTKLKQLRPKEAEYYYNVPEKVF